MPFFPSSNPVFLNFLWLTAPFLAKNFTLVNYFFEAPLKLKIDKFHKEYQ
jgi:hypothetical protein